MADVLEKISKANELKEEGNAFFKDGDFKSALRQYHFAWLNIKGLGENVMNITQGGGDGDPNMSAENKATLKALTESLHLNLAACYLKTEQYSKCIASCTKAITVNDQSVKAYFRRGQAYLKNKDTDKAENDVRKAASLSPSDGAIRKELQRIAAEKKRQNQKQAKTFKGFFDKVDLYDDKEGVETSKKAKVEEVEEKEEDKTQKDNNNNNNNNNDNDNNKVVDEDEKDKNESGGANEEKDVSEAQHSDPMKMD